jgi:hypothetical protein
VSSGCTYCGVNPYVGCRHRPAVDRPKTLDDAPVVEKVDGRKVYRNQGRAFASKRNNKGRWGFNAH